MEQKLILPAEVKVCATCSYWDGERKVDTELGVVVVAESCEGECLVQEKNCCSLQSARGADGVCDWEHLAPDEAGAPPLDVHLSAEAVQPGENPAPMV